MKKTYNNILDAFKSVFGSDINLNTTFEDLNPYQQINTNDDSMLAKNVKEFIDDKKNMEHKKKEDEMVKNWQDEIEINKGGK
tara:strand:+ start:94 stop:339 length:246 start_codon:yes stop_codon:yes gene_type:complete